MPPAVTGCVEVRARSSRLRGQLGDLHHEADRRILAGRGDDADDDAALLDVSPIGMSAASVRIGARATLVTTSKVVAPCSGLRTIGVP